MNNKLLDLNNHLFAEIERLSDEETVGEKLQEEIERAKAISCVSTQIIQNAALSLRAEQFRCEYAGIKVNMPKQLID